jgi:Trypsin-like peptidase domain
MRTFLQAAFLTLVSAWIIVGCSHITPSLQEQSLSAVRLQMGHGICSGTVVGPSVILTADHCFTETAPDDKSSDGPDVLSILKPSSPPTTMLINGRDTKIIAIVSDHNDHALVEVDYIFDHVATLSVRPIVVGSHIHYWGNPDGLVLVYREGYVATFIHELMMLDVNGFFGDSGSGVFDDNGHVIGVINTIDSAEHQGLKFSLMGSDKLEFTVQQYEMMGIR